jgi:two-component sensor histidine kinase
MDYVIPEQRSDIAGVISERLATGNTESVEVGILGKDGQRLTTITKGTMVRYHHKPAVLLVLTDISDRKKAEEQLKRFSEDLEQKVAERTKKLSDSLAERELLLREIHHRVKNNLQIIISLLSLQSRTLHDPDVIAALKESTQRIRAMSMVHEKLYIGKDFSHIELRNYVTSLANSVVANYQLSPGKVKLEITGKDIMLDINTAIPLGLVVNELVSNALKHAFPGERRGTIRIGVLMEGNSLEVTVTDDGVGAPESLDWQNTSSLGLRLVKSLVEQLEGTIEREPAVTGTVFRIVARLTQKEKQNRPESKEQ